MLREKLQKSCKKYYCENCYYLCVNKTNFNKHLQTVKHCAPECSLDAPLDVYSIDYFQGT